MSDGDTAPATSAAPSIADQVQSAFAALRAETTGAPTETAEATTDVAPEASEATETEAATEASGTETETEPVKEKVRFKIGDEEVDEDTLLEWKRSGLRQDAFTRKTQEVAAQRKQVEQERAKERAETLQKWQALEDAVASVSPKEPDWAALRAQVRAGALAEEDYNRFAAKWQEDSQQRQAIAAERQKAEEAVQKDRTTAAEATAKANYDRVLELMPDWKDLGKRQSDFQDIIAYAAELGVDETVLAGLPPEGFKMARDAVAYHKLQQGASKPKVVKVDAATLKPGATSTAMPKTSGVETATRRLAQTHTDADGVAAFREFRKAGGY